MLSFLIEKYTVFLSVLGVILLISCKTQNKQEITTYEEIMSQSVQLQAIQQKGRNNPGKAGGLSDTLYVNDRLPKEVVDSINNARKLEYRRLGY